MNCCPSVRVVTEDSFLWKLMCYGCVCDCVGVCGQNRCDKNIQVVTKSTCHSCSITLLVKCPTGYTKKPPGKSTKDCRYSIYVSIMTTFWVSYLTCIYWHGEWNVHMLDFGGRDHDWTIYLFMSVRFCLHFGNQMCPQGQYNLKSATLWGPTSHYEEKDTIITK